MHTVFGFLLLRKEGNSAPATRCTGASNMTVIAALQKQSTCYLTWAAHGTQELYPLKICNSWMQASALTGDPVHRPHCYLSWGGTLNARIVPPRDLQFLDASNGAHRRPSARARARAVRARRRMAASGGAQRRGSASDRTVEAAPQS